MNEAIPLMGLAPFTHSFHPLLQSWQRTLPATWNTSPVVAAAELARTAIAATTNRMCALIFIVFCFSASS